MSVESLSQAKAQAKALRAALAAQGTRVSHAQALEIVAHQNGARDWNTLHARLARAEPTPLQVNDRVSGHYLGQAFTARVVAVSKAGRNLRVTLRLDAPVDTVRFDSFSNMRQQVSAVVGPDGRSTRKTSDGTPHLVITLPVNG
ncbi:MAG: hypothetical protein KDJ96_09845 [Rhodobacteraceae bacterium]|nr:hypothetical protein [Paracoccaceae bacterium]